MHQALSIRHFRGIPNLRVDDLGRINLFTGLNNAGKTSILEALFLQSGEGHAGNLGLFAVNPLRGEAISVSNLPAGPSPWEPWFTDFDMSVPIELMTQDRRRRITSVSLRDAPEGEALQAIAAQAGSASTVVGHALRVDVNKDGDRRAFTHTLAQVMTPSGPQLSLQVSPHPPPPPSFRAFFITDRNRASQPDLAASYSDLRASRRHSILIEALKSLEPRLREIDVLAQRGGPELHLDVGGRRLLPLSLFGSGMVQLAEFVLAMTVSRDGLLLVDEIENGIHYSAMSEVWRVLAQVSVETRCQIFATTHSRESVMALRKAMPSAEDVRLFRVARKTDEVEALAFDPDTLDAALELGLEIR